MLYIKHTCLFFYTFQKITDLPPELLVLIFAFLDVVDLLKNVSVACRTFYEATKNQYVFRNLNLSWKMNLRKATDYFSSKKLKIGKLTLRGPRVSEKKLAQKRFERLLENIIPQIICLSDLQVTGTWHITANLCNLLGSNSQSIKHLRSLELPFEEPWPEVDYNLIETELTNIIIKFTCVQRSPFVPKVCMTTRCLKRLVVVDEDVTPPQVGMAEAIYQSRKSLEHIDLNYQYSTQSVILAMSHCASITYLRLLGHDVSLGSFLPLSALSQLKKIKTLCLELLSMSNVGHDLEELLKNMPPSCTTLKLQYDHFTNSLLEAIASCGNHYQVLELDCRSTLTSATTTAGFAKLINSCTKLTDLTYDVASQRSEGYPKMTNNNIRFLHADYGYVFLRDGDIRKLSENLQAAFCGKTIYARKFMTLRELTQRRNSKNWDKVTVRFL